jgi:nitrate/nitrite transporter NarK
MKGVGGKPGWAWIFILEGLFTILIGIASYWMVHDFPDEAKFLSDEDRARVLRRLKADRQSSAEHEEFKMEYFWSTVKDVKTWLFAIVYMGADGTLYAFSLFLPTIIANMGFKTTKANLLSVPPYAAAAILTITVGFVADRTRKRGLCNIIVSVLGVIGFIMLISTERPAVQYAGTFLGALGIYPCIANTISWASNNFEGVYRRGVALGIIIGWGNLNGVVASNIYRNKDKPRYLPGHGTVIGYMGLFLFGGSIVTHLYLRAENKKRMEGKRDHWIEGKSEQEIEMLGDKRYEICDYSVNSVLTETGLISSTRCRDLNQQGTSVVKLTIYPRAVASNMLLALRRSLCCWVPTSPQSYSPCFTIDIG